MFSTDEFGAFTQRIIPLAHITTQVEGDPDQGLLGEKGGSGFPTLAFLDAEGRLLGKPRGRSVEAFASTLEDDIPAFFALEEAARSGDAEAQKILFLKQIELGHIDDFDAAYARLAKLELGDAQEKSKRDELVGWEFSLASARSRSGDPAGARERLKAMKEGDRIPGGRTLLSFWVVFGRVAVETGDAEMLKSAIEGLKEIGGRNADRFVGEFEGELKKLEG